MLKGQKKGTTAENNVVVSGEEAKIAINHKGKIVYALVDSEDVSRIRGRRWNLFNGYVGSKYPTFVYLHRFIMNAENGAHVDHKFGDKLDNRKSKLRLCNQHNNQGNRRRRNSNNTSGYRGVQYSKDAWRKSKWKAVIKVNYKSMHLGYFKTQEEAAKAYNEAAKKHFGDFAVLNP